MTEGTSALRGDTPPEHKGRMELMREVYRLRDALEWIYAEPEDALKVQERAKAALVIGAARESEGDVLRKAAEDAMAAIREVDYGKAHRILYEAVRNR